VIDTHCHLLPALDDGPPTPADAVALGRHLTEDGVSFALCTPHYSELFPTRHADAAKRLTELRDALAHAAVRLETALAAEVGPDFAISEPIEELRRRSIAGRYVLVEVVANSPAGLFAAVTERLTEDGLIPIFGHPERARGILRRTGVLDYVRRQGALLQVVAPSLIGRWGDDVATAAWRLVDTGRADLLASDAHGARRRRCHLRRAAELVRMRLGANVAAELTERGPGMVLQGEDPRQDVEKHPY
jgi:protein-tyrosine phosphatase